MKYPADLIIRPLEPAEWPLVTEKFERKYGAEMPQSTDRSLFYGIFLSEHLVGFAHLEQLFHLNAIYVDDEHRGQHLMEACFETIDDDMPRGWPMIIFPYKGLRRLLRRFGFWGGRPVDFWRKDY